MRSLILLVFASIVTLGAFDAAAQELTIAPITISEQLQEKIDEDFGPREAPVLRDYTREHVAEALARAGGEITDEASIIVSITLVDAKVSRPTLAQLGRRPGLDYFSSISIGGAELEATIRNESGAIIAQSSHRYFRHDLFDGANAGGAWADARRAIRQFARKLAQDYTEAGQAIAG